MPLIDVSLRLSAHLPTFPGNSPFELRAVKRLAEGGSSNVSTAQMSVHAGTHVDAPRHFFDAGAPVDQLPLDVLVGPARVVHFPGCPAVGLAQIDTLDLSGVTRLLIRTDNSDAWANGSPFTPDFVYLDEAGARRLLQHGIRLVGIDSLSVERFKAPGAPTHHVLLGSGVVVVEGLDLSLVAPGTYELLCLPLRIGDSDGAPARAVLRVP